MKLEGKVAIVTGGGRGIGREIAIALAKEGADMVICSRTPSDLEKVRREIQALDRRCLTVTANISIKSEVENLVDTTVQEFGTIDILVNNAGIEAAGPIEEVPEEQWDNVMDVNLKGQFLCSQAVFKEMRKRGGKIINIARQGGICRPLTWVATA